MLRRSARILFVTVLLVFLGGAVISQVWSPLVYTPSVLFSLDPAGIAFEHYTDNGMNAAYDYAQSWTNHRSWLLVHWVATANVAGAFLPWWLLFAAWGLLTLVVWRLTRRRDTGRGAFPIEPTAKSK